MKGDVVQFNNNSKIDVRRDEMMLKSNNLAINGSKPTLISPFEVIYKAIYISSLHKIYYIFLHLNISSI